MAAYRLKQAINGRYSGRSQRATKFRYGLIAFDLATIAFLVATAPDFPTPFIVTVDFILGLIILADLMARLWIALDQPRMLRRLYTLADILVILTLLLAPFRSDEHTSDTQYIMRTSYAIFCLKKKKLHNQYHISNF